MSVLTVRQIIEKLEALPDEAKDLPLAYSVAPSDEDRLVVFDDVEVRDGTVLLSSAGHIA